MTGPVNAGRYHRRFPDPKTRPSNLPFAQWAAAETLETVRELGVWLDQEQGAEVVAEAEAILRPVKRRMASDPGA